MFIKRLKITLCYNTLRNLILIVSVICFGTFSALSQTNVTVTGVVTDNSSGAIPGVNVTVKGTNIGVLSDEKGYYSINIPSDNAVLVFSLLGYGTREITVRNQTTLNVTLSESTQELDEVVVVGYGTTSKRKMTASVSTIAAEPLANLPAASVVNNLGGRTPGIFVTPSSVHGGGPGVVSSISIRGGGTPIVVIDGIVSSYNDFRDMNQNDIANVSILKDAAAAAVYGSRAGNGIVLVTTKRGDNRPLQLDYNFSQSFSQPTIWPNKLNSYDFATYVNRAYDNQGSPRRYSDEQLQKFKDGSDPYYYPDTDWVGLAFKNWAPEMNHNLTIRGGDERNKYYVALGYFDQNSLMRTNTNWYRRFNARLNMENSFDKIGLKTTSSINITYGQQRTTRDGFSNIWGVAQAISPVMPAYNDKGLYSTTVGNILEMIDPRHGYVLNSDQIINGLFQAEWQVPKVDGLKLKSTSDYRMAFNRNKDWLSYAPQGQMGSDVPIAHNPPSLSESYSRAFDFTQQFFADYERKFLNDDLTLGAMFGYEFNAVQDDNMNASRENYVLSVDQFIAGPTTSMKNGGSEAESGRAGFIGRIKADYKARYMVEASFRRDGSDWFPKDKRWGTFYSFSGGWVLSDEPFMKQLKQNHWLDYFKFRASYGIVGLDGGSAGISRFEYIPGYNSNENIYVIDGKPVAGFSEGPMVSPYLTWYTLASTNLGFDFSTLNETLYGGFDYFRMRTSGYLASPSGASYTAPLGASLPKIKTDGALRRGGWEAYLGYKNTAGEFSYDVSANVSYFDQLWEMNPNEQESTTKNPLKRNTHRLAYNTTGYHSLGYYKDEADVLNSPRIQGSSNLAPGDIKYADIDGNGVIDSNDQIPIGKGSMPHLTYGINVDLKYKAWFMNMLFQGSAQRDIMLDAQFKGNQQDVITWQCQTDFWTPENTGARFPRLLAENSYNSNNNIQTSDFWLISGNYFRLKSLQIGYDFKKSVLKDIKFLSNTKLILSGTNLFTISEAEKYGLDPEGRGSWYSYGTQRVFTLTINIGF